MAGERLERNSIVLRDATGVVFSNYPINFAGAALFLRNDSDADSVVRVHESDDAATWDIVLVSTHAVAGQLNVTIPALGFVVILFTSASQYVRLSLAAENLAGIYASMCQYPPKAREQDSEYA